MVHAVRLLGGGVPQSVPPCVGADGAKVLRTTIPTHTAQVLRGLFTLVAEKLPHFLLQRLRRRRVRHRTADADADRAPAGARQAAHGAAALAAEKATPEPCEGDRDDRH